MRYAAAYVLAILGGNANPDVAAISKILGSVGVDCDKTKAQKVVDACKGKDIEQIIAEGTKKLSSLPTGGGSAVAASAPTAAAATTDAKKGGAKEEPKKEVKKKEESDEEGDDMVCIRKGNSLVFINIFVFIFRVLVYLIKCKTKQNKSSFNLHQTNSHHQH